LSDLGDLFKYSHSIAFFPDLRLIQETTAQTATRYCVIKLSERASQTSAEMKYFKNILRQKSEYGCWPFLIPQL